MYQFYFLKLDVWKNSRDLSKNIYQITSDFPSDEKYNLVSQIRRAAISICCNIAEGSSRTSGKEQARYSEIAFGSLMEVLNLLLISKDFKFIPEETFQNLQLSIETIAKQLTALRKTQKSRDRI